MAITTDTGAKKIENSENWRNIFGIHNDTVDAYDALAEQKDEEIGIVVKGNKTAHTGGAAAGQYIILRNSTITGCDDGLYTAAQAIPYDTVIDSTYLTAVSGGGLNALNASLEWKYLGNLKSQHDTIIYPEGTKELYIVFSMTSNNYLFHYIKLDSLPNNITSFNSRQGYYLANNNLGFNKIDFNLTTRTIERQENCYDSTSNRNNTDMLIYYR